MMRDAPPALPSLMLRLIEWVGTCHHSAFLSNTHSSFFLLGFIRPPFHSSTHTRVCTFVCLFVFPAVALFCVCGVMWCVVGFGVTSARAAVFIFSGLPMTSFGLFYAAYCGCSHCTSDTYTFIRPFTYERGISRYRMSVPKEWLNTWNLFDERKTGTVSQVDLKHIVRSLGRRYTEAEFNEMLHELPDPVPYQSFVELMQKPYSGPSEDDLRTALRAFDSTDSGRLKLSELITLLTSLGEKMPEHEVRQLLAEVRTDEEGRIDIEELTRFLCTPVPSMTPDIAELQKQLSSIS